MDPWEGPTKLPGSVKILALVACTVLAFRLSLHAQGKGFNTKGNIVIADQFNNLVIEINPDNHEIVWQFGNHQVIEIGPNQNIVFSQGQIGVPGTGFNMLNAPYDAKVVGITPV